MASIFSSVPLRKPKSSAFNMNHTVYATSTFGRLFPTCCEDLIPSDIVKGYHANKVRFLPMLTPPFGQTFIKSRTFFCPYRLVIPGWEKFITGYYEKMRNGQIVFDAVPNVMVNGNSLIGTDSHIKYLFSSEKQSGWSHPGMRNLNLLDYLHIQFPNNPTSLPNFEIAKVLAFWKIYFDYFVDENIGFQLHRGLDNTVHRYPLFLDSDGSIVQKERIFEYDDLLAMIISGSDSRPSEAITLGSAIEKGGIISFNTSPYYNASIYNLLRLPSVTYQKDYFTSSLPWAQKGQPVTLPIFNSETLEVTSANVQISGPRAGGDVQWSSLPSETHGTLNSLPSSGSAAPLSLTVSGQTVNVANLNPLTINDLRVSFRLQEWLERNARGGSRYIEQIQSHFGVRPQDYRLQRSEYIAGSTQPIVINEVVQTSQSDSTPLGTMGGHSVTVGSTPKYRYKAYEHGVLLTLTYITVKPIYYQGVDRRNTRVNFYDFCFPEFAHLGEQAIDTTELQASVPSQTFGFQSRYAEYKHERDSIVGGMTSSTFLPWLFGVRNFENTPTLSPEFLHVDPSKDESLLSPFPVVSSSDAEAGVEDQMIVESYNAINMLRPLPKYGVPYM